MVHDGAREVHEITWQACPKWDKVSSELACRTNFTVHLDSTFLGVHLDSTFLSSGLDLAKEELRSSWWTRAWRYRNSSGRLGMGNPGAVKKFLVPLQGLQEKGPLIWVVQGSRRWHGEILGSWRGLGEECCQGRGWSMNESFCSIPAVYISQGGSR